ncbi:helix-turn-helix domain-containing protein [Virgibacillus kimchii]
MKRKSMTVKEMAAYLGIHRDTVYKMVRAGEIPHYRLRGKIQFSPEMVDAWIREQELQGYYDGAAEVMKTTRGTEQ